MEDNEPKTLTEAIKGLTEKDAELLTKQFGSVLNEKDLLKGILSVLLRIEKNGIKII